MLPKEPIGLTKMYITNNCLSWDLYKGMAKQYDHPFMASLFVDDAQYVKFCRRFNYYINLEPVYGRPSEETKWAQQTGSPRFVHSSVSPDYAVVILDDIEIHYIHQSEEEVRERWSRRVARCKASPERPMFFLTTGDLQNDHTPDEYSKLIIEFLSIPTAVYITKFPEDEVLSDRVILVDKWVGVDEKRNENHGYTFCDYNTQWGVISRYVESHSLRDLTYIAAGSIFKNEAHILEEWFQHHLHHGISHFYMINDGSTDDYLSVMQPYIDKGIVTLYQNDVPRYRLGRSRDIWTKYLIQHLPHCTWLALIDLDEFLWSPKSVDLRHVLKPYEAFGYIEVNWVMFGSSGHVDQPPSVVKGFTKRGPYACKMWHKMPEGALVPDFWPVEKSEDNRYYYDVVSGPKCIVNTKFTLKFDVHGAETTTPAVNLSYRTNYENPDLLINHYFCQSEQYWKEVKCKRGELCYYEDNYRDMDIFELWNQDTNSVEDTRLVDQNYQN